MPYCSFVLCLKDTDWRFDSDHGNAVWYVCTNCQERYAIYSVGVEMILNF